MSTAQGVFDSVCAGMAPSDQITTCAGLAEFSTQTQQELECAVLASDVPDGSGGTVAFSLGACNNVVGPIIGALETGDSCEDWVGTFTQDAIDTFSTSSLGEGNTCTSYGNGFTSNCLEDADGNPNSVNETEMYLLNPAEVPAQYGFFVTYNGTMVQTLSGLAGAGQPIDCVSALDTDGDGVEVFPNLSTSTTPDEISEFVIACNPHLFVNDSDHDFDPSCLDDGNTLDCSGRLVLTFEPTCVPEIEARQIVAEFVDLNAVCSQPNGDVDYSCAAYDWNHNYQADCNAQVDGNPECEYELGDGDGQVTEQECHALADALGYIFS
jgi:hypothetical protein